ncbi:MAG: hypothetical protein ACEPOV_10380 [Hyphomicrobiales bacterium]
MNTKANQQKKAEENESNKGIISIVLILVVAFALIFALYSFL